MSDKIDINGELITTQEAMALLRMLYEDAKRMAGKFHGMNRSAKFRVNWPNEYDFAKSEWRNFVEPTRLMYTEKLADPLTSEYDKARIFKVLILQARMAQNTETDNRLQIAPGTQQFEGDKKENKNIMDKFGARPNFRAWLKSSTARSVH